MFYIGDHLLIIVLCKDRQGVLVRIKVQLQTCKCTFNVNSLDTNGVGNPHNSDRGPSFRRTLCHKIFKKKVPCFRT